MMQLERNEIDLQWETLALWLQLDANREPPQSKGHQQPRVLEAKSFINLVQNHRVCLHVSKYFSNTYYVGADCPYEM